MPSWEKYSAPDHVQASMPNHALSPGAGSVMWGPPSRRHRCRRCEDRKNCGIGRGGRERIFLAPTTLWLVLGCDRWGRGDRGDLVPPKIEESGQWRREGDAPRLRPLIRTVQCPVWTAAGSVCRAPSCARAIGQSFAGQTCAVPPPTNYCYIYNTGYVHPTFSTPWNCN